MHPSLSGLALYLLSLFSGPLVASPHTCLWSFPGGSPASSRSCTPPPVTFSSSGPKTITLTVCTPPPAPRCSVLAKTLTVLADPRPVRLDVSLSPVEPYVGDLLHLSATTTGRPPFSYLWTFPGGTTSHANPTTFDTHRLGPGVLAIRVRSTSPWGSLTKTVTVSLRDPSPRVGSLAVSPPSPAVGALLTATAAVTGRPPLSYRWTLDGRMIGTAPALSWIVAGVGRGAHTLKVTVSNASGSAALARLLTVTDSLVVRFEPVCPSLLCLFPVGTPVGFTLQLAPHIQATRFDYDWSGNGAFTESSPSPVSFHIYTAPGNYRPRVRVTTASGSEVRQASQFLLVTR